MLLAAYAILLTVVVGQLVYVMRSWNKKRSFYTLFLIFSFFWTAFRVAGSIRILIPGDDSPFLGALIWQTENWLAIQIQWAMFSLLLLYYFRLLSGPDWSDRRPRSQRIYIVTNLIGLIIVFVLSATNVYGASSQISTGFYDAKNKTQDLTSLCSSLFNAYSSIIFICLIIGMTVFSLKLYRTNRVREYFQLNVTQHVVVNTVLSLVFFSRALFDMYNALIKYFTDTHLEIDYPENGLQHDFEDYVAILLFVWEVLPMIMLIVTLIKSSTSVEKGFLFNRGHLQTDDDDFNQLESHVGGSPVLSETQSVDSMEALLLQFDQSSGSEHDGMYED